MGRGNVTGKCKGVNIQENLVFKDRDIEDEEVKRIRYRHGESRAGDGREQLKERRLREDADKCRVLGMII